MVTKYHCLCLGQLWKLDDTKLVDKAGVWNSNNEWKFVHDYYGRMYIESTTYDTKVLGIKDDEVITEVKDLNKSNQLWIKGEEKAGGYFTLKNSKSSKVLTALSASDLNIKGI